MSKVISIKLMILSIALYSCNAVSSDRIHRQLIMFIDHGNETPDAPEYADATTLTTMLGAAIWPVHLQLGDEVYPFIVSDSIVHNLLVRVNRGENIDFNSPALDDWHIYKVQDTPLMLWVPKRYNAAKEGFLFEAKNLVELPNDEDGLRAWLELNKLDMPFDPAQLFKVFKTRAGKASVADAELPVWDIVVNGHGNIAREGALVPADNAFIAGMSAKTMQELLKFLNNELNVGGLLIQTCSAGGQNIDLLQFDQAIGNSTLLALNFMIIVAAVSDMTTISIPQDDWKSWKVFFDHMSSQRPLGDLIRQINWISPSAVSPHGSRNIPQVWVPGGLGFQTFQVDERLKILSKALVAAHEDEGSPIDIPGTTDALLIYPQSIGVPITVMGRPAGSTKFAGFGSREAAWDEFPTADEMLIRYPKIRDVNMPKVGYEVFPKFISMKRAPKAVHHFKRIDVEGGLISFIRDAFVEPDLSAIKSEKTFLIDELKGRNDLSLLLKLIREKEGSQISPIEQDFWHYADGEINLRNVMISEEKNRIQLSFTFFGKSWIMSHVAGSSPGGIAWRFISRPSKWYEAYYKRYVPAKEIKRPLSVEMMQRFDEASGSSSSAANVYEILNIDLEQRPIMEFLHNTFVAPYLGTLEKKIFIIDEVVGINDLLSSPYAAYTPDASKDDQLIEMLRRDENREITLYSVMIGIERGRVEFGFVFKGMEWANSPDYENITNYSQQAKSFILKRQPSISDVLKKRSALMRAQQAIGR